MYHHVHMSSEMHWHGAKNGANVQLNYIGQYFKDIINQYKCIHRGKT